MRPASLHEDSVIKGEQARARNDDGSQDIQSRDECSGHDVALLRQSEEKELIVQPDLWLRANRTGALMRERHTTPH